MVLLIARHNLSQQTAADLYGLSQPTVSEAGAARATFTALAAKHGVAVAMVSDDRSILRP
jgi:predicted XRE-type DNA-binding protein